MEPLNTFATKRGDGNGIENDRWKILRRAVVSGTLGGWGAAIVAALAGKYENNSFAAPLNATSHIIWGDKAARQNRFSLKYTLTGFILNHASGIFWALFYEKLFGLGTAKQHDRSPPSDIDIPIIKPLLGAAVVTASAYVIDYYFNPRRLTPGFEKRVSGKSLAAILTALAVGLAARDIINTGRTKQKTGSNVFL